MPEGDTIHRLADRLRPVLVAKSVVAVELARPSRTGLRPPPPGTTIEAVDAQGKHLLIRFGNGVTLRTHLRMNGTWQLIRTGERWSRPRHRMRARVAVDGWEAVCFDAPVVELERRPATTHLGPDLAGPEPDLATCLARLAALVEPGTPVAEALLDQRVACGVGNVYKSEVCFACGLDPRTPVGALDQAARTDLLTTAARLLHANLGPGPRTTVTRSGGGVAGPRRGLGARPDAGSRARNGVPPGPGERTGALAVYGRAGQPCRRCGTRVQVARTGPHARSTYWCPTCQPRPSPNPGPDLDAARSSEPNPNPSPDPSANPDPNPGRLR